MTTLGNGMTDPALATGPALAQIAAEDLAPTRQISQTDKKSDTYEGGEKDNLRADVDHDDDGEVQEGVRVMRAITQVWSKQSLIAAYALMWIFYFIRALSGSVTGNLGAFVTSDFSSHSLIPLISIVADVMAAALYMPIAKALNLFERGHSFLFLSFLALIGHIMCATCHNVETYAAAQVFTSIGLTGMTLSIDVITADTSKLKDRGFAYAFTASPYLITTFGGSKMMEHFHETNWRWAYGVVCILIPVVAFPVYALLEYNKRLAIKQGVYVKLPSQRSPLAAIWHYVIEFDLLGVFLLGAGLALFLIPFNIAYDAPDGWKTGYILAMLIVGFVMLLGFGACQMWVSKKPVIPFGLLTSPSVLGGCLLSITYFVSVYCYSAYFTSFLQVVYGVSVSEAGYMTGAWDIVSGLWLLVAGYLISRTHYFRWLLFVTIPLYLLGAGLLIYFRQPGFTPGYIVMCIIFMGIGGGTVTLCEQIAVLSVSSHNNAAAVLGLLGVFGNIGGGVGSAISGAIWTHTFPQYLERYLPEESMDAFADIYGDLDVQLSYEMGTPTRDAIIQAYAHTQRIMLIATLCVMVLCLLWSVMIKNVNLAKVNQTKGRLF